MDREDGFWIGFGAGLGCIFGAWLGVIILAGIALISLIYIGAAQ